MPEHCFSINNGIIFVSFVLPNGPHNVPKTSRKVIQNVPKTFPTRPRSEELPKRVTAASEASSSPCACLRGRALYLFQFCRKTF